MTAMVKWMRRRDRKITDKDKMERALILDYDTVMIELRFLCSSKDLLV